MKISSSLSFLPPTLPFFSCPFLFISFSPRAHSLTSFHSLFVYSFQVLYLNSKWKKKQRLLRERDKFEWKGKQYKLQPHLLLKAPTIFTCILLSLSLISHSFLSVCLSFISHPFLFPFFESELELNLTTINELNPLLLFHKQIAHLFLSFTIRIHFFQSSPLSLSLSLAVYISVSLTLANIR